jgi:hypothetical protein
MDIAKLGVELKDVLMRVVAAGKTGRVALTQRAVRG